MVANRSQDGYLAEVHELIQPLVIPQQGRYVDSGDQGQSTAGGRTD